MSKKQRSKAIDRAEKVIQNRIYMLQEKIDKGREPEKIDRFQEEIDELLGFMEVIAEYGRGN